MGQGLYWHRQIQTSPILGCSLGTRYQKTGMEESTSVAIFDACLLQTGYGRGTLLSCAHFAEPKSVSEEVHLEVNVARLIRLAGFSSLTWRASSPT